MGTIYTCILLMRRIKTNTSMYICSLLVNIGISTLFPWPDSQISVMVVRLMLYYVDWVVHKRSSCDINYIMNVPMHNK